jgi:hypothetical protein
MLTRISEAGMSPDGKKRHVKCHPTELRHRGARCLDVVPIMSEGARIRARHIRNGGVQFHGDDD